MKPGARCMNDWPQSRLLGDHGCDADLPILKGEEAPAHRLLEDARQAHRTGDPLELRMPGDLPLCPANSGDLPFQDLRRGLKGFSFGRIQRNRQDANHTIPINNGRER